MRTPVTCLEWSPNGRIRSRRRPRRVPAPPAARPHVEPPPHLAIAPAPAAEPAPVEPTIQATAYREDVHWESTINKVVAGLQLLMCVLLAALWPAIGSGLALPLLLLCVAGAAYYGISWLTLAGGGTRVLRTLRWANVTVEASIGTMAIGVIALVKGGEWAMTSGTVLLYVVAIVTVSARMKPGLCLYVTAVIAVEQVAVYYLLIAPGLSAAVATRIPTLQAWSLWERVFWLAVAGGLAALVTDQARRRLLLGEAQAWEKRWLEREFSRYVSPDVVHAILRGEAAFGRAERREVTVLFCDLRDFTPTCERESPEDVVRLLNAFYERVCTIVEAHGGTVNKFLGDGVLALFGAPDEHPNHAPAAAEAAHEILVAADELRRQGGIWARFDVGIGIDTGDVVVGPIGAAHRMEYTAIGATVNRAARLQSLSRGTHRRIILSQATLSSLGPRANVVSLGNVNLKGFSAPETVFAFRHS